MAKSLPVNQLFLFSEECASDIDTIFSNCITQEYDVNSALSSADYPLRMMADIVCYIVRAPFSRVSVVTNFKPQSLTMYLLGNNVSYYCMLGPRTDYAKLRSLHKAVAYLSCADDHFRQLQSEMDICFGHIRTLKGTKGFTRKKNFDAHQDTFAGHLDEVRLLLRERFNEFFCVKIDD